MNRLAEILEQLQNLAEINDEELAALEAELVGIVDELNADRTDENIEAMGRAAEAIDALRAEAQVRIEAAEAADARAEEILTRVHGEDGEEETEGDENGDEAEPAEGDETEPAETEPAQAVAASAPAAPAAPRLSRIRSRVPARQQANRPNEDRAMAAITAAVGLPNISPGQELTREELARAFVDRADMVKRTPLNGLQIPVARVGRGIDDFPRSRRLSDADARANMSLLATEVDAVVASGGLCAPLTPLYDQVGISVADRPLRESLPSFGAERGGARWVPPPRLDGTYDAGVDVWTVANDITPADPTTKPCVRVDCDGEQTIELEAITKCLELGNFFARTYDERVQAILDILDAIQARFVESRHLTVMGAASTQLVAAQHLGASRDLLAHLDLLTAGFRSRWRTRANYPLRTVLPFWLRSMFRADLTRSLPSGVSLQEQLAMADATYDNFFAVRNIRLTEVLDGESGQVFGLQGDGAILPWPTTVVGLLFHEGAWTHLDGGELNLGIVRDSTLNSTNDLQIWSEVFENVFFRGWESDRFELPLCADGSVAGTVDATDICDVES